MGLHGEPLLQDRAGASMERVQIPPTGETDRGVFVLPAFLVLKSLCNVAGRWGNDWIHSNCLSEINHTQELATFSLSVLLSSFRKNEIAYCGRQFIFRTVWKLPYGLVRRKAVGKRPRVSGMPHWDEGGIIRPQVGSYLVCHITHLSTHSPTCHPPVNTC